MMHFTDLAGLAGVVLAIVALALRVPVFARLQLKLKIGLVVGLLIALAIPFGGLSSVEFMRGITGDLSITTLVLLAITFKVPSPSSGRGALLVFITFAAIALYPLALGISTFDPYRLGFGNLWFIAGLLLVALAAWFRQYALIALSISLAVLAWSVGWYESNNLWNYLIDPWLAVFALVALVKKSISFASRSKSA
jgi:hypothetical protein